MGIIEARKNEVVRVPRIEIVHVSLRPGESRHLSASPYRQYFAAAHGHCFDDLRLIFSEPCSGVDDAVEEEIIRNDSSSRCGLGVVLIWMLLWSGLGRAQY